MTQGELFEMLTAAGLYPIPVEGGIDDGRAAGLRFVGDAAGFVAAAKALGARCVFVASRALAAADFEHAADADDVDEPGPPAGPATIDLATLRPELGEFKVRVGEHVGHRLWVAADRAALEFVVLAPWWERLTELRDEAVAAVAADREATAARREDAARRERDDLLAQLRGMIGDSQFLQQTTQIAMQAYAVERLPALEALGDRVLKAEVQALDAKIKARGLRAKK